MSATEMSSIDPLARLAEDQTWISPSVENAAQGAIRSAVLATGGEALKSFLHGDWLHEPLHAVLTDIPVGAWSVTFVFDLATVFFDSKKLENAADASLDLGLLGASAAAVAGAVDWSEIKDEKPRRIGSAHALLNVGATGLLIASTILRRKQRRSRTLAKLLATTGYAVVCLSAHLGGNLIYEHGVGVRDDRRLSTTDEVSETREELEEARRRDPEDRPVPEDDEAALRERNMDKTLADSFPTSDPPSSIPDPSFES